MVFGPSRRKREEPRKFTLRTVFRKDGVENQPTFTLAHEALNSRAKYYSDVSVYEVREKLHVVDFDVVIFSGIYYHL